MATYHVDEIASFMWKFSDLWRLGKSSSLLFESNEGMACVTLRLGLGYHTSIYEDQKPYYAKKKSSPSRIRRCQRRAAAETTADKVEVDALLQNKSDNSVTADCTELEVDSCNTENDVVTEIAQEDHNCDTVIVESDEEIFTYTYHDTLKPSDSREAVAYLSAKLQQDFNQMNIKDQDRDFKILGAHLVGDNDVEVKMKMKKCVISCARNIQTRYVAKDPIYASIKRRGF